LVFSVTPSSAHWRRHHWRHAHDWCFTQYCRAPIAFVAAPWDVPFYRWSPYSVVNGVMTHRAVEIGPTPVVLNWAR
jgi:hypothetical protein